MTGRTDEAALVLALAEDAAGGRAATLLVSGEAGVGKTSLLRDVCGRIRAPALWAPCLPLASLAVPFLPLRTALREVPDPPPMNTADAVLEFDAWLDRRCREQPTLLVVDDVQWADQSSLDVFMYVIAGRPERRLAVFITSARVTSIGCTAGLPTSVGCRACVRCSSAASTECRPAIRSPPCWVVHRTNRWWTRCTAVVPVTRT
ncbi:ATP-binding protein [Paractinoplanes rishiriensis]|uniref:ATP-binding protein n=1 Tax=Paractinoplanes rishiriensis TaxID=1050105 RepID=UPI0019419108|nr:AAA family ATPase [Actinoplanes rishiriensis]